MARRVKLLFILQVVSGTIDFHKMQNSEKQELKTSKDAYGRDLNVKYISLGSIFRQFILSRVNINYLHYIWHMCLASTLIAILVFLLKKYFEAIPRVGLGILALSFFVLSGVYCVTTDIVEESVKVIDGFGIQISSKGRFGKENRCFFDFNAVKEVIINEAITMQRVLFYLALTVNSDGKQEASDSNNKNNQTRLVVLFKHMMPKLDILQDICNEIEPFLNNHNHKRK